MKHMSTWDLLDLAEDYRILSEEFNIQRYKDSAKDKLASIDTELLSRMPEGEFITVLDDNGNLVGFEPYIGEDNEYDNHLSLDDFNRHGFYD